MFNKFVADLLTTYLGEYFDNIDREQVKVSIWNGRVHLRHLKVRRDALRFFDVPVCVLMGAIEELTVIIPWTNLRSESVVVQIRNARLILSDKETAAYDVDQEKREEHARKTRELDATDAALLTAFKEAQLAKQNPSPAFSADASTESSDNNFTARLKATILNNVRVDIEQLFVHYTSSVARATRSQGDEEDSVMTSAAPQSPTSYSAQSHGAASPTAALSLSTNKDVLQASLSFQIRKMTTCGCNERFEPAFVTPGKRMSRQLIAFRGLAVSLRTGAAAQTEVPLLHPFDISLELAYQPVVTDPTTPQYMLALHMDETCACVVTSESCTTCYELLRYVQYVRARQALRRLRPVGARPSAQPRLWWRYVSDAVRQQVRHDKSASLASAHTPAPFSWFTYTTTKAKRDRYMRLYLRRQRVALGAASWLEPLTADEHVEMVALEEELTIEVLKLAKRLALERVTVERGEYEKLLREKKESLAASPSATSPSTKSATAEAAAAVDANAQTSGSTGGWFSFWRSVPRPTDGSGGSKQSGAPADNLDDEARAELRELVQLMTAAKWTDAQRAVIAQEFGMSAEEARELTLPSTTASLCNSTDGSNTGMVRGADGLDHNDVGGGSSASQRRCAAPAWVVFVRAISVSLELRSCKAEEQALHRPSSSTSAPPAQETLAKLLLGNLQSGAEWGDASGRSGAAEAALPLAYYWGCVELLSVTAAKLNNQTPQQQQGEQAIVMLRRPQPAASPLRTGVPVGDTAPRRTRAFSPLEACWSILSDECCRRAAWQCEWTQRSPQQLTSRAAVVHRVCVRLAPLHLVFDIVPLRHLVDFFFTVMWPSTSAVGPAHSNLESTSPPVKGGVHSTSTLPASTESFLTALLMPTSRPLTHVEQRCATDTEARLIVLRRKVERQHSIEWDVLMDSVTVSLSEIPDVQGCELTIDRLGLRNDIVQRLQRQERLQCSKSGGNGATEGAAAHTTLLGSEETDWFDYTHVEAAAASISVFLPAASPADVECGPSTLAPPAPLVVRRVVLSETPFALVVERSLLGRCLPEKPPFKLRLSSSAAVQLSWSRSSLSVLTTSCSTLVDLVAAVAETLVQRGGAASISTETEPGGVDSTATFHVGVVPHRTRMAYWRGTEAADSGNREASATACDHLDNPEVFYKQMHPFSASRLSATTGITSSAGAAPLAKRRVDIRTGVCVLYHPERASFPAEYFSLQRGCIRVRRTETKRPGDNAVAYLLHLYVLQGGVDQEQVLTDACDGAAQLLVDAVGVPPALLQNAVWLERAVLAWIANQGQAREENARQGNGSGAPPARPLPSAEQVRSALELALKRAHLMPCRYVAFQCATAEEAQQMEKTLLRCCVDPSTPSLELTPAVQVQYNAAVVAPQLRKQPLWSVQVDFSSLRLTCEGREPAAYCDELPHSLPNTKKAAQTARRDAVLSFTPFGLSFDRFAEKQRFELTVTNETEMYACSPRSSDASSADNAQDTQAKQSLLRIEPFGAAVTSLPPNAPAPAAAASLFLRFIMYFRPQPLPSMKRCGIYVDPASAVKLHVGPAMFEWVEAWWDSFGLWTDRLFAEEVIAGYPWWSLSPTEPFRKAREVEAAWCSADEYGGNAISTMVDLTVAAVEVEVALRTPAAAATVPSSDTPPLRVPGECVAFQFAARDVSLRWRLTEALNHVHVDVKRPVMQWRCPTLSSGTESAASWVVLMDSQAAIAAAGSPASSSGAGLSLDWKLHKTPPMLSTSDWLCNGSSTISARSLEERAAHPPMGFRDRQEVAVELRCVKLLYWHPLLMQLILAFRDDVLHRAATLVHREPCWFHAGVLYCPPLTWPHRGVPPSAEISWDDLRKSVTLLRAVLRVPDDARWLEKASHGAPVACSCEIAVDALTYAGCLRALSAATPTVSPAASPPPEASSGDAAVSVAMVQRCEWASVEQVHTIAFHEMSLRRCDASATLSTAFAASLPRWTLTMTLPVYQTSSIWKEKETWHKTFHVCFHRGSASGPDDQLDGGAVWRGTSTDLAVLMNLVHANYVADSPASSSNAEATIVEEYQRDVSPASLLHPVVETSTWVFDVETRFQTHLLLTDAQNSACEIELGGAHAVVDRNAAGELSCALEARHFVIGSDAPYSREKINNSSEQGDVEPLFSFPAKLSSGVPSSSTSPLLRIRYGWRWLAASTTARALHIDVDATHDIAVTVDGLSLGSVQSLVHCPALCESVNRYIAPGSSASAAQTTQGWATIAVKLQFPQLHCHMPCVPSCEAEHTSTSSICDLQLCASCSRVLIQLRKEIEGWKGMLHVGRLVRCVLHDHRETAAAAALVVPLVLEQPAGWSQPVASSPRAPWRAQPSPSPTNRSAQTMDASKLAQQNMLDELFGELPSPVSTAPPAPPRSAQPEVQEASQPALSRPGAEKCLVVEFAYNPAKSTFTTVLQPFWVLTPSMAHMSLLLAGVLRQVRSIAAVFQQTSVASASPASPMTTAADGSFAVDVRVGTVAVFVLKEEVTVGLQYCTARQVEDAVKHALDSEALLVTTEAVVVQWNSDIAAKHSSSCQTVLQLRNTSICALRGQQHCTLLLERFSIDVTRQLKQSDSNAPLEEWKLSLEPLQLTLTQFHYAALLRVAFQQASFLAMLMNSASTASHSLAAAVQIAEANGSGIEQPLLHTIGNPTNAAHPPQQSASHPGKCRLRSYCVQLTSLNLRVEEDSEDGEAVAHSGALTAVYVQLERLDATYFHGKGAVYAAEQQRGQTASKWNGQLRIAISLQSCLVGKEGAIPTLSLAALPSSSHTGTSTAPSTPSCELHITENEETNAKSGVVSVRQVTVTVEAVPVMAWVDLLYAPYLQVALPNYQTARELVVQRDLWLSEDLVLTERAPLRAVNKLYSLLYLYGNGRTIYLNAARRGQLILLDEGMTLRIMHANICMEAESIEAYISAGNGSYVVVDRETCTVMRPSDAAAAGRQVSEDLFTSAGQADNQPKAVPAPLTTSQQASNVTKWADFEGDVQVQLRVPEPRTAFAASPAASPFMATSAASPTATEAQRTLVLYSDMHLTLVNSASTVDDIRDVSGFFSLAHAGVRTEFLTAHGATVDTSDLLSDWAMTVQYTEETCFAEGDRGDVRSDSRVGSSETTHPSAARRVQHLRNVSLDASSGVEMRVHYSDVFFVLRAARHAQAVFAKWKDAMRRDLGSSLLALPQSWDGEEVEGNLVNESLMRERNRTTSSSGAASSVAAAASSTDVVSKTSFAVQIPYLSFFAVDDSQNTHIPLFCLYVNEVRTPSFTLEAPHVKAELQFTLQLDSYGLAKSQWAPVVDPLRVNLALDWRRNTSISDVYNRQGFVRLAVQTGSVKVYATLELLRNLRQLQLLRAKFEEAGVEMFKHNVTVGRVTPSPTTEEGSPSTASSSSFHAFTLLQTTGLVMAARLPQYIPDALHQYSSSSGNDSRALASGESWAFNLPRSQGKELPREQQKILVQQHATHSQNPSADGESRGAVVSVASVGVQRVSLSTSGPLRRYVVADVAVPPQQQGLKRIHLHSTVLFQNRLSSAVLQLAMNQRGTYDAVGVVAAGAAQYVSVDALRRRVCLALSETAATAEQQQQQHQGQSYALSPDSLVTLGVSYDALPCLVNHTFLCVTAATADDDVTRGPATQPPLAKGKGFTILGGKATKRHFLLQVVAAANQPLDVRRYPALAPLRVVTVVAEAAVTIHNAVGLPLIATLLTRRVQPGMRVGLLDPAPDTAAYTVVHTATLEANASYGATEMDPLDDVCVSVALQQPNGNPLLQWSSQVVENRGGAAERTSATAYYPPACIYCPGNRARRDGHLVLADPATGATLVLHIKYTKRLVTLYCPHWIVNETQLTLQLADTSLPHAAAADRCTYPIAGLGGRTVRSGTMASWDEARRTQQSNELLNVENESNANSPVYLYNSLRAESCSKNKNNADGNGLFVRVWETAPSGSNEPATFSDWSQQSLSVHEAADEQVVTCASRRTRGMVLVLSCRVELGSRTLLHAYSDTHVVYIRPRWVLMNKSPYTLCFAQSLPSDVQRSDGNSVFLRVKAFSEAVVPPLVNAATAGQGGCLNPLFSFSICDDAHHNVQQCCWSSALPLNVAHDDATNLVYHSLIPIREYWPQSPANPSNSGSATPQTIPDRLPLLQPEDIKEVNGELFVDREETKVFTTTAYAYKGCMMCVEVEEAPRPPIVVENRTLYTVRFRQRGVRRVSTVFPRCRKAWTWDAAPSGPSTPAVVELWLEREQDPSSSAGEKTTGVSSSRRSTAALSASAHTLCVLNFDPQLISQQSRSVNGFQQEIEVEDPARGTSTMLFVRVRGVHGMSYAVSITTEPTIDAYRTLPYPQLSFALQVESVFALLCGEDAQGVLSCAIEPLTCTFAQGVRRRRDGASSAAAADVEAADADVQRLQLRFHRFQVDDERPAAKECVVAQLVDDRESGLQVERKLLRTTPILCCSTAAFHLAPLELHVEDGFITAMMSYQEVIRTTWDFAGWMRHSANWRAALSTAGEVSGPPWRASLDTALTLARHAYTELADGDNNGGGLAAHGSRSRHASAPLWSRVVAIDQLYIDPILVSLSLYRSPGAADDPLWKIAGAASLLVGSTQDARLQWDAVQRRRVCDTIWHLFFVHRNAYQDQMKKQYMSLVNVMGLDTMRNFVSDLLNAYSDDPRDRRDGGGNRAEGRRQKPRVPLRPGAKFGIDEPQDKHAHEGRRGGAAAVRYGLGPTGAPSQDAAADTESLSATTIWLQQTKDRRVQVNAQRTETVSEVARSYTWNAFMSVAQAAELRAFGGVALARSVADMASTPRYTQAVSDRAGGRRMSAQEIVVVGAKRSAGAARVQCTRCVELEALRLKRMHDGAATPLPHPIRDGLLTWEEFAHHINWYEFLDMCSDDEVCKYAPLLHAAASEASSNVCIITLN
ncbi:hypothetical protein ABB37_03329 [Leptomonas pyrrhocoris]|uniref:Chorein N-terminal domain-containing protein n=1 Tax=Leptomonas pyrrhocoris TaxID=157538 RepID=A0A0M9G4Y1_LEPPY|nr:hypothetical protein ABB37_03329 [Leptomonas pyrrhocoris]KPA82209.1 hypothetical protein ABB37_03329 [Leptomonas pyrrhocoris]|eukprot:XP_015660648.1 hypothetical protein ABB37_03329 [Leptomonas pyrrhocoris]